MLSAVSGVQGVLEWSSLDNGGATVYFMLTILNDLLGPNIAVDHTFITDLLSMTCLLFLEAFRICRSLPGGGISQQRACVVTFCYHRAEFSKDPFKLAMYVLLG